MVLSKTLSSPPRRMATSQSMLSSPTSREFFCIQWDHSHTSRSAPNRDPLRSWAIFEGIRASFNTIGHGNPLLRKPSKFVPDNIKVGLVKIIGDLMHLIPDSDDRHSTAFQTLYRLHTCSRLFARGRLGSILYQHFVSLPR